MLSIFDFCNLLVVLTSCKHPFQLVALPWFWKLPYCIYAILKIYKWYFWEGRFSPWFHTFGSYFFDFFLFFWIYFWKYSFLRYSLSSFKPPHLMEDGMKSGKTQRANLTPATLLHYWPSSALVRSAIKLSKSRTGLKTRLHTSVSPWVNTSSLAQSFPPKELIKSCIIKHWYTSMFWKGSCQGRKLYVTVSAVPLLPN